MKTNIFGSIVEFERHADGTIIFKLKDIVRAIGLAWDSQFHKVKKDPLDRYCIVEERFGAEDGKTYEAVGIPSENVQNFLDDINVNRCTKDVAKMILRLRDNLRGKNLAEEAMQHLV